MVSCSTCKHCGHDYLRGILAVGSYHFAYCQHVTDNPVVVDAQVKRSCLLYEGSEKCRPLGRKPKSIRSQTICERLNSLGTVRDAAQELGCSVGYIYKVLTPLGLSPAKVARGEQHYKEEVHDTRSSKG